MAAEEEQSEDAAQDSPKRWHRVEALLKNHLFRAAMTPEQLEAHRRELAELAESDFSSNFLTRSLVPSDAWQSTIPIWRRCLFGACLKALYYTIDAVSQILPRRRPSSENRPLRVLRIASRLAHGGVAKVYVQSSLAMPADRVEYILWPFGEKRAQSKSLGIPLRVVNRKMEFWPGSFEFAALRNVWVASREIRRARPDLVHVHEPQFAPLARIAAALAGGVPVVMQLHSDYNDRFDSVPRDLLEVTRHALRRTHLLACSGTIREAAARWLDVPLEEIGLAEDGTDDRLDALPMSAPVGAVKQAAAGRTVVAMMSHNKPFKRIEDFLAACRILLDDGEPIFVLLMVYGRAKTVLGLKHFFDRAFEPHEGQLLYQVEAAQRLLPEVDIGVSASVLEGLGLNVLEFQLAGVPVICTAIPAHLEMVADGVSGLLFEGANVAALVRRLRELARDPDLRRRLGDAGREQACRRRWADTCASIAAFYEKILEI